MPSLCEGIIYIFFRIKSDMKGTLMKEAQGTVENGRIKLLSEVELPEGMKVRVIWDERTEAEMRPYEREELTEEDVHKELMWATGRKFRG
jgi:predicted DNA-binding antitoxin AbrB/MazE fold protein